MARNSTSGFVRSMGGLFERNSNKVTTRDGSGIRAPELSLLPFWCQPTAFSFSLCILGSSVTYLKLGSVTYRYLMVIAAIRVLTGFPKHHFYVILNEFIQVSAGRSYHRGFELMQNLPNSKLRHRILAARSQLVRFKNKCSLILFTAYSLFSPVLLNMCSIKFVSINKLIEHSCSLQPHFESVRLL